MNCGEALDQGFAWTICLINERQTLYYCDKRHIFIQFSDFTEWSDASPLWVGGYLLNGTTDEWQWINDGGVVDASLFNQASLNYFDSVDGGYLAMRFRGLFSPYRGTERFPFLCEITGQQRQN